MGRGIGRRAWRRLDASRAAEGGSETAVDDQINAFDYSRVLHRPEAGKTASAIDGRNRIVATRSTGTTEFMAQIVDGTLEEAARAAVGVNGKPQQTRSPAGVRRDVGLADPLRPLSPDRQIAEDCECSPAAVDD